MSLDLSVSYMYLVTIWSVGCSFGLNFKSLKVHPSSPAYSLQEQERYLLYILFFLSFLFSPTLILWKVQNYCNWRWDWIKRCSLYHQKNCPILFFQQNLSLKLKTSCQILTPNTSFIVVHLIKILWPSLKLPIQHSRNTEYVKNSTAKNKTKLVGQCNLFY